MIVDLLTESVVLIKKRKNPGHRGVRALGYAVEQIKPRTYSCKNGICSSVFLQFFLRRVHFRLNGGNIPLTN